MAADSLFEFSDLKNQVCLNIGATDDVTQAKAGKWINRALIRLSEFGIWSWQRVTEQSFPGATSVTVAGTAIYSVKDCLELHSLYYDPAGSQWGRIKLMDLREFRRRYQNATSTGRPYLYTERGRVNPNTSNLDVLKVGLYPIPDTAYTLKWDGIRKIALLSSDTDDIRVVTGMPTSMVDIVIEMATEIGWREIDDADDRPQMQEVLSRVKSMFGKDNHSIEDRMFMRMDCDGGEDFYRDPVLPPQYDRD